MKNLPMPSLLFDQEDHELLRIVNEVLSQDKPRKSFKKLFGPYLHPHGIKEMAAPKELRIAYAMIHLLDALNVGKAEDRLKALRSVMDEVLHTAESSLRKNTARVLLQIMKELVRAHDNYQRQLELAHDFRTAASGKPRIIREQLHRYHLLEMPEAWNQITFDDHVHDANTKGRKSATHLVMDAWIKGIRSLTVIYYNYVPLQAAAEIVEAAEIMGITVRLGLELSARFRDRYVQCIWIPRGFSDAEDFLEFLETSDVQMFLEESRQVSAYQQHYVFAVFDAFNTQHRLTVNAAYSVELQPISQEEFRDFVEPGQPSLLHLSDLIQTRLQPLLERRLRDLQVRYHDAAPEEQSEIEQLVEQMGQLNAEMILHDYLDPSRNPTLPNPDIPNDEDTAVPEMLTLSPSQLFERLYHLHSGYRITLNLSGLTVEDVLELLYDSQGMITHLEIFNLKDYTVGTHEENRKINELQRAVNSGNVIKLKRLIREIIHQVENSERPDKAERCEKLSAILCDITTLRSFYKKTPLKSRIGTDSTGRFAQLYGMHLFCKFRPLLSSS